MIDVRPRGTFTAICGRAEAKARPVRPARNSATGMPAPTGSGRQRLPDERHVREAHGLGAAAPELPDVGAEQQRHRQHEQQGEGPGERHD